MQNGAAQYSGSVTSISPGADARNRVFAVEVTLSNRKNTLKPGMIASVELGGKRDAPQPSVPLSAIVPYPGESGQFAVVVAEQQSGQWKAHIRRVTVGETHGISASVTGFHAGEKVVAIGAQLLKDGDSLFSDSVDGNREAWRIKAIKKESSKRRTFHDFSNEHPVLLVLLFGVLVWGWFGYNSMPQRKDPNIPVRVGVASCSEPGATSQQVEQLITRPIEDTVAQNKTIHAGTPADYGVRSISLPGYSYVYIQLIDDVDDLKRQFSDINLKLNALNGQLPQGAGPITFQSDFGDTAALMLTVASPKADAVEIDLRSQSIQAAVRSARVSKKSTPPEKPVTIIYPFPESVSPRAIESGAILFEREAIDAGILTHTTQIQGTGFIGFDGTSSRDDAAIQVFIQQFFTNELQRSELHPDAWSPIVIHDPAETREKLWQIAGDKYSYAELDDFSDLIARTVQGAPETSKVERRGVQQQTIYLEFSQDRLAAYGLQPADLSKLIQAHNIIAPGGVFETGQREIILTPSGQFENPKAIGDSVVTTTAAGAPVYLRDLVDISRGYQSPATYLNYYTWRDADGHWRRSRAVTIAIYMRDQKQIAKFGESIDVKLAQLHHILPADLITVHTSDQPLQVKENIHLFLRALEEAIVLVVIVSLLGFWEWRLALIMALAIPITLAMTFGVVYMLGIDLQQVSVATLIIALGLLVRCASSLRRWYQARARRGPPAPRGFVARSHKTLDGNFFCHHHQCHRLSSVPAADRATPVSSSRSLPIVMTASLLCALVVYMTFIPILGYYNQRSPKKKELTIEEKRERGFYGFYNRLVGHAIQHRWIESCSAAWYSS